MKIEKTSQKEALNSLRIQTDNLRTQHANLLANLITVEEQLTIAATAVNEIIDEIDPNADKTNLIICCEGNEIHNNYVGNSKKILDLKRIDDVVTGVTKKELT